MKMLTVSVLVCAVMALTAAADVPEAEPVNVTQPSIEEESQMVDRSTCPRGWSRYGRRCFLYVPSARTWTAAESNCHRYRGNLASVHSVNEYLHVQRMIQTITHSFPVTWLGGTDAAREGTWLWSDGTPFRFSYWDRRQPDNLGNADCLVMNFGGQKRFDDQPCRYNRPSVCARNL